VRIALPGWSSVGGPFAEEIVVTRAAPGRFGAVLGPGWNLRPLPQGGIVTALALRAMEAELDDSGETLRTLSTVFVGQVTDGPLEIDVEVLRRGRSMSHLRAEVRNPGSARGHVTTAVFGQRREGFEFTDLAPPVVPLPGDCPSFRDPPPPGWHVFDPMPFWERVEGRPALGLPPWDDTPRTSSLQATWYRFDETPWLDDGTVDPHAVIVLADTMPGAVGQRLGSNDRPWFGPSIDLTVHLFGPARDEWLLGVNRARHAGDGYASVEMELWSAAQLVAYGTQTMFFAFMDRKRAEAS
jgi:acyl-CoA thioesterase